MIEAQARLVGLRNQHLVKVGGEIASRLNEGLLEVGSPLVWGREPGHDLLSEKDLSQRWNESGPIGAETTFQVLEGVVINRDWWAVHLGVRGVAVSLRVRAGVVFGRSVGPLVRGCLAVV